MINLIDDAIGVTSYDAARCFESIPDRHLLNQLMELDQGVSRLDNSLNKSILVRNHVLFIQLSVKNIR